MSGSAFRRPAAEPAPDPAPPEDVAPWPRGVSREPAMSIGAFVKELNAEFPAVTISKIRFLEDQGLVTPTRTGSGYRKYSRADIERVRYVLTRQRDAFLPLRVIRGELEDMDEGREVAVEPIARVVSSDGHMVLPEPHERVSVTRLYELTGASETQIEEMVSAGLISTDTRGRMTGRAVPIIRAVLALSAFGLTPRHLRAVRMSALREADTIETVIAPLRARRHGLGRESSAAQAAEMSQLYTALHAALLHQAVDEID